MLMFFINYISQIMLFDREYIKKEDIFIFYEDLTCYIVDIVYSISGFDIHGMISKSWSINKWENRKDLLISTISDCGRVIVERILDMTIVHNYLKVSWFSNWERLGSKNVFKLILNIWIYYFNYFIIVAC